MWGEGDAGVWKEVGGVVEEVVDEEEEGEQIEEKDEDQDHSPDMAQEWRFSPQGQLKILLWLSRDW